MEDFKKKISSEMRDKEIVYSQAVKAGKRIYYLDVKRNRKDEMFLAITESKKIITGEGERAQVSFEKHKIFLYKEDFTKFMTGLEQAIDYIAQHDSEIPSELLSEFSQDDEEETVERNEDLLFEAESEELTTDGIGGQINIDIEFE